MPTIDKEAKIPCPTPQHLQAELDALMAVLELREQEDTWEKMERAIIRFTGVTRGGGYKHLPVFVDGMGKMGVGLKVGACMLSDRGRLSGVATELLQTLAPRLSSQFQPLVPIYLPPLVQLLGRPNKVFLKRAEKCLWTIITHCHLSSILFELRKGLSDEAATCRRGCASGVERALLEWDRGTFGEKGAGAVEEGLRRVGTDKDPEVRATGKRIWMKFSEIWPERVDEFSGPLTPTIRRYLGVAAANGGPSKPLPKAVRPVAARPPPAALTASSSSSHAVASMPAEPVQHARVQALGGRAVRPTPVAPVSEPEPPIPISSESSRPRKSPVKAAFPAGPSAPPFATVSAPAIQPEISEPPRQRILSSRAPRYPPGVLGHAGRSVSHMVLSSTADIPPTDLTHNPLSQPSRPNLPTSFSTTSLPPDLLSSEAWRPQPQPVADRKFAPPARIVRTLTSDDLAPTTPHILRGAVKSSQAQAGGGQQRRGLGQAQRRVVTAPIPACPPPPEVDYTPLPLPPLKSSPSVKERIEEMERRKGEVEAASVPLPSSPLAERYPSSNHASPIKRPGTTQKEGTTTDSPFLPRMERAGQTAEERMNGDLRDEEMPEEADLTISEPQRADVQVGREESVQADRVAKQDETMRESTIPTEEPLSSIAKTDTGETRVTPIDTPLVTPEEVSTDLPTEIHPTTTSTEASAPPGQTTKPVTTSKAPSTATVPMTAPVPVPIEAKSRKPPLPPVGPPRSRAEKPTTATSAPLPPVAAARSTKPRVPSAETRKPFRPTTKAAVPTASSSASGTAAASTVKAGTSSAATTQTVSREPTVRPAKPPVPSAVTKSVSTAPKPAAVSTKPAVSTSSSAPKAPVANAAPRTAGTSSNLTKPTAASAHRAATVPAKTSKPPVPVSSTTGTAATALPPVKKEKIKRKAAVPSFRPVPKSASVTSTNLAASTASARGTTAKPTGGGKGGKGEIVARVKVRPEAIALPVSPGENRAEEIPLPPSPVLGEFTGRVKVKSRPSELSPAPLVKDKEDAERGEMDGGDEPVSPLVAKIPLPASPTVPTAIPTTTSEHLRALEKEGDEALTTTHDEHDPPSEEARSPSLSPEPKLVNQPILFPGSHPPPDQTPQSKASTAPALSDWMGSDSEEEEPVESPRDRVSFSSRHKQGVLSGVRKFDVQPAEEKDLIEFSAPSRPTTGAGAENEIIGEIPEVVGKKSPEGIMGSPRVVLSERDANGAIRAEELL